MTNNKSGSKTDNKKKKNIDTKKSNRIIYLISTEQNAKKNIFKVGRHKGTEKQLLKRYTTYLINPVIYFFQEVNDYCLIETKILEELGHCVLINVNGNKSEWIELEKNKIIRCIKKNINAWDNDKDFDSDNNHGLDLLINILNHSMLKRPLDASVERIKLGNDIFVYRNVQNENVINNESDNEINDNDLDQHSDESNSSDIETDDPHMNGDMLNCGESSEIILHSLSDLIRYIYMSFKLDYDVMKKIYSNIDGSMNYDFYTDENNNYLSINFSNSSDKDHKYSYFHQDKFINCARYYDDFIEKIHTLLTVKSTQQLFFENISQITLLNTSGICSDSRGVRDVDWKLHFWDSFTIESEKNISLHDFIIALYKIKSHKFENNFELFAGIKKMQFVDVGTDRQLFVWLCFDHGS